MDLIKPKRVKLSKRMNLFLDYSIDSLPFWDLCCDHGLVGLGSLVFRKNSSHVYFVDQVPHIMTLLQKKINQLYIKPETPHTLYCVPAEELDVDVEGVVLIAGVGGMTIKTIISTLLKKDRLKAKRLILSPHTDIKVLEEYCAQELFKQCYDLKIIESVIVGKKEKPLYIFESHGE